MTNDGVSPGDQHIDRDFAHIVPEDAAELAKSIAAIIAAFPNFMDIDDVKQQALKSIGVDDIARVIKDMGESADPDYSNAVLIRELRKYTTELKNGNENGDL